MRARRPEVELLVFDEPVSPAPAAASFLPSFLRVPRPLHPFPFPRFAGVLRRYPTIPEV